MPRFYHIDRLNKLNIGDEIKLIKYNDVSCINKQFTSILQKQVDFMFKDGVSNHGEQYYISNSIFNDTSLDVELVFELYRRIYYPNNISRFQSFFCVSKDILPVMIRRLNANINLISIYEVECDEYEKHDMNLLRKSSNLVNTVLAETYWKGDTLGDPLYEILAKPPIKVIGKVNFQDVV